MRLRLFERLGRLVSWRPGWQGAGSGRPGRLHGATARTPAAGTAGSAGRRRRAAAVARRRAARQRPSGPGHAAARPGSGRSGPRPGSRGDRRRPGPRRASPTHGRAVRPCRRCRGTTRLPRAAPPAAAASAGPGSGRRRSSGPPRWRPPPAGRTAPASRPRSAPRQPWYQVVGEPAGAARAGLPAEKAQARNGTAAQARQKAASLLGPSGARARLARDPAKAALPFAAPHPRGHQAAVDGLRHCGPLEAILWRQWDAATTAPPPQAIAAIERLAEFPRALQEKLADGLDGIYVGAGGVPDLDDMGALHGVQLPSGKATWDACAGAYGDRKIVVGTRPSPTPDVMCHEVGHALDDLDSPPGKWQSDSPEFRRIYDQCQPYIASDFHRQGGGLGRKEFFADSFAAIASAQRPALVDMLGGNTRLALQVMLYFNRRYGI